MSGTPIAHFVPHCAGRAGANRMHVLLTLLFFLEASLICRSPIVH